MPLTNRSRAYGTLPSPQERARRVLHSLAEHPTRTLDDYQLPPEVRALVEQAQARWRQRAAFLEATFPQTEKQP